MIAGTDSSKITVSSGLTCPVDTTQTGQVTVEAGAALPVTNSTVNSPAPTDARTLNTVSAVTASDQCTDLEEQ